MTKAKTSTPKAAATLKVANRAAAAAKPKRAARTKAPPAPSVATVQPKSKIAVVIELLRRPEGATVEAIMEATGWQKHSVRGAMSGAIKTNRALAVTSEKTEAGRVYRIVEGAGA